MSRRQILIPTIQERSQASSWRVFGRFHFQIQQPWRAPRIRASKGLLDVSFNFHKVLCHLQTLALQRPRHNQHLCALIKKRLMRRQSLHAYSIQVASREHNQPQNSCRVHGSGTQRGWGKRGANLCRTALAAVLGPRRSSAAPGRAEDFHLACPATQYPSHSPETYAGDLRPAYLPGWAPVRSGVEAVLLLAEDHIPHTMPEA